MAEAKTVVKFGNPAPQMQERRDDGTLQSVSAKHINQSVTRVEHWEGFDDPEAVAHTLSTENDRILAMIGRSLADEDKKYAVGINEMEQIIGVHTGGAAPTWVACDDADYQRVLAKHFNCAEGESVALLTNTGRDGLHAQFLSTSAPPATFNYMALANSATATTPLATDTVLTGEITTTGGGLIRAQATYAHTAGTNTSTLTKTFTANGSDALPVTVSQQAVFNASTAGTMALKTALNANATLTVSGDNVAVTETVTAG